MATQEQFSMADMKDILVNRVGLPEDAVGDDPSLSFDDLGPRFARVRRDPARRSSSSTGSRSRTRTPRAIHTMQDAIDYTNRRLQEQG